MDCEMPVMDGFEATQKIRASCTMKIPIFALTADASKNAQIRCAISGFDLFLNKPIQVEDLMVAIAALPPFELYSLQCCPNVLVHNSFFHQFELEQWEEIKKDPEYPSILLRLKDQCETSKVILEEFVQQKDYLVMERKNVDKEWEVEIDSLSRKNMIGSDIEKRTLFEIIEFFQERLKDPANKTNRKLLNILESLLVLEKNKGKFNLKIDDTEKFDFEKYNEKQTNINIEAYYTEISDKLEGYSLENID